jgi:hypothetical protein
MIVVIAKRADRRQGEGRRCPAAKRVSYIGLIDLGVSARSALANSASERRSRGPKRAAPNRGHCDKDGPLAGVPYDGRLTKADGKRTPRRRSDQQVPARPALLRRRLTDTGLPLYDTDPTVGLRIAAHYYNVNRRQHGGKLEAVLNAKRVNPDKRGGVVLDIERGGARDTLPRPWAVYGEGPSTTARGRAGPSMRGGDGTPRRTCASPPAGRCSTSSA